MITKLYRITHSRIKFKCRLILIFKLLLTLNVFIRIKYAKFTFTVFFIYTYKSNTNVKIFTRLHRTKARNCFFFFISTAPPLKAINSLTYQCKCPYLRNVIRLTTVYLPRNRQHCTTRKRTLSNLRGRTRNPIEVH